MESSLSSKPNETPHDKEEIVYDDGFDEPILSKEELDRYHRQVKESEGFDIDSDRPFPMTCGSIIPIHIKPRIKDLQYGAEEAIKHYNLTNDTYFEVVEIEKATMAGCLATEYYITFKAKPLKTPTDHPTTTFQAKVTFLRKEFSLNLCRIKKMQP